MRILDRVTRLEARVILRPVDLWAKMERYRKYFAGELVDLTDEDKRKLAKYDRYFEGIYMYETRP
jgi:hypothetical protein